MGAIDTTITTERLRMRPFEAADAPELFGLFRLPEVARWSGTGQPMPDVAEAAARIERYATRPGPHPAAGVFATFRRDTGAFVGSTLLVRLPPSNGIDRDEIEVGWHLHPDHWGQGFATEAATALVQRGLDAGLQQIYAVTNPDNVRSQAVCRRLGMADLGLTSDWYDEELRAFRLDHP